MSASAVADDELQVARRRIGQTVLDRRCPAGLAVPRGVTPP
jgi:hypothetical protein